MKFNSRARLATITVAGTAFVAVAFLLPVKSWVLTFLDYTRGLGWWGPVVLAVAYIPASLLFVPGLLITLGAGWLFGVVIGTVAVSIGSVLGAMAAFIAGRTIARGWVEERVRTNSRFQAIDRAVARQGFKVVLLTRLSPAFPYNRLNYAYGATSVRLRDYALASWVRMFPCTVMYAYLGSTAASLADLAGGRTTTSAPKKMLFAVGLVTTVIATAYMTRLACAALAEAVPEVADEHSSFPTRA